MADNKWGGFGGFKNLGQSLQKQAEELNAKAKEAAKKVEKNMQDARKTMDESVNADGSVNAGAGDGENKMDRPSTAETAASSVVTTGGGGAIPNENGEAVNGNNNAAANGDANP
eukprot:386203_1